MLLHTLKTPNKLLLVCLPWTSFGIEEPEPSSVLRPRSYNPHPYEGGEYEHSNRIDENLQTNQLKHFENLFNQGPIQFPPNDPPSPQEHPYEKVSLRDRERKLQRFAGEDAKHLSTAYSALSRHAQKVLSNQLEQNNNRVDDYYDEPAVDATHHDKKHYAFSYTVKDKASGDDFSHTQQQVNGAVKGSYKVMLPDGRMQIVTYIADDQGYRAEVSYEGGPEPVHKVPHVYTPSSTPPPAFQTAQPIYEHYKQLQYPHLAVTTTAEPYYPSGPAQGVLNVHLDTYNSAPHKQQLLHTKAIPSPSPATVQYSTPSPIYSPTAGTPSSLQIQSNHLEHVAVTTPVPQYEDIDVAPRYSHSTVAPSYISAKSQQPNYDYYGDYQSPDYVHIQASPKYARSLRASPKSGPALFFKAEGESSKKN